MTEPDPFDRDVIALFGLPFDVADLEETASRVLRAAKAKERLFLSTVNLDWIVQSQKDAAFKASALASNHVTMDGVPVVKLAQLAGVHGAEKAAGSDLFERLRRESLSVFFFGGREGAAKAASDRLDSAGGPMRSAGWHDPGFGDVASMSTPSDLGSVNESGADILVVALGAKKGQAWLMANKDSLLPPVITHLGAVVDFTAGTIARAPKLLQTTGFEWAWRIAQDRALAPRYAEDFTALPNLLVSALRIRREIDAMRDAGGAGEIAQTEAGPIDVLQLSGNVDSAQLRSTLSGAWRRGRDLKIDLLPAAALDLFGFGQLLIANRLWRAAGRRCELCTQDENMTRLAARVLQLEAVPGVGL